MGGCLGSERVGLPAGTVRVLAFILSEKVELERSLLHLHIQYHRKIPNLFQMHHHIFTFHQVNGNT